MHPLVSAIVNGQRKEEALRALGDRTLEPIEEALFALEKVRFGEGLEAALAKARAVAWEGCDANLVLVFLATWTTVTWQNTSAQNEGKTMLARAKALLRKDTPPELRALILHLVAMEEGDRSGNIDRALELLNEIRRFLGPDSPRYPWHLRMLASSLAGQGRLVELNSDLEQLLARTGEQSRFEIADYRFVDATQTCRLEEATRWYEEACRDPRLNRKVGHKCTSYTLLCYLKDPRSLDGLERPEWIQVLELLRARRPAEALSMAREEEARCPHRSLLHYGFDSLTLLRAELANGHVEAARRLLDQRRARGNRHYLDDLFYARIEWREGRPEAAARHFDAVQQAAARYRAQARVDYELGLACELSAGDCSRLTRAWADQRSSAEPERPVPVAPAALRRGTPLVGASSGIERVRRAIEQFAPLEATVLISGETGTGKELVARALHEDSARRAHPFVAVNCGAIPETLLGSELFGHERGAFTGAERAHRGYFEQAANGTLFLDEVGELSPRLQAALLRVLESGEIRPVGGTAARRSACRIVAATNAPLGQLAAEGGFRRDLLFRLKSLEILVPPLRERAGDVPLLLEFFLSSGRAGGPAPTLAQDLKEAVQTYAWPGNVRELRIAAERMRLLHPQGLRYTAQTLEQVFPELTRPAKAEEGGAASHRPAPAAEPKLLSIAAPDAEERLRTSRSAWRQIERLRELFQRHGKLNRAEAAHVLGVRPKTATGYLKLLCLEGFIEKRMPSASPRSHYFAIAKAPALISRPRSGNSGRASSVAM